MVVEVAVANTVLLHPLPFVAVEVAEEEFN